MNNTDMKELLRTHSKRRHPKRHIFLKGMIIYSVLMLVIIAVLACVGWKYASLRDDMLPEREIEKIIEKNDLSGWRQLLLTELPKTYPAYEDGARLAREVLADRLEVGEVTYLKYAATDRKNPVFLLLSDGIPMAEVTLRCDDERFFGVGEWDIAAVSFRQSFFESLGVEFRTVTVAAFEGSILSVNGCTIDRSSAEEGGRYPALLPCEEARSSEVPCDIYTLEGIYYEPEISATLNGSTLTVLTAADGTRYFSPGEGMTNSVSVTVPSGVTVSLNGVNTDKSWAQHSYTDGTLGALDEGGDGTPQLLEVWRVDGLFFTPEITAQYSGKPLNLLSEDNGHYVFETPDECRFTLVVLAPRGAVVTVNGRTLDSASAVPGGASLADLEGGMTLPGLYGVSGFEANSVVPAFDKYIVSGFLAHPTVTASLEGAELMIADDRTEGYFITAEFDIPTADVPSDSSLTSLLEAATAFAENYFDYISCGGNMGNNYAAFDESYGVMLGTLERGTPAFLRLMESYASVYRSPAYSSHEAERTAPTAITKYSENCISVEIEYSLLLKNGTDADAAAEPDKRFGTLEVLMVNKNGTWRVLSYIDSPDSAADVQTEPAP